MKSKFSIVASIFIFSIIFSFKNEVAIKNNFISAESNPIQPKRFLPTLIFRAQAFLDCETCFPISFSFNTKQDANADGKIDVEDNLENLILYSIGNNISGNGRTGLKFRGPNDQRPAIYFHFDTVGIYQVYEYWLYYADNDYINKHEHDWEKYFVYVVNDSAKFIKLSHHKSFTTFRWENFLQEDGHPKIIVHRGSHALRKHDVHLWYRKGGVKIRYDGEITKNKGRLEQGNGETIPWVIYSNDRNVQGAISFPETIETFFYGDPFYLSNRKEFGDARLPPWKRVEWDSPPLP